MWRSIAVFRVAALGYAAILVGANFDDYAHPLGGWIILALMGAWTAVTTTRYLRPPWPLLGADLTVTLGCLIATRPVVGGVQLDRGTPIIPVAWLAGPVLAWAVAGRRRAGLVAGAVVGVAVTTVRGQISQGALTALVVLMLTGAAVGYVSRLSATAEAVFQQATQLDATTRERERIARTIHDSVLQALAMIERRGIKLGGEAAELARMAGEQGAALRALVAAGSAPATHEPGTCDLVEVLGAYSSATVSLVSPADPIRVPAQVGAELGLAALPDDTQEAIPRPPQLTEREIEILRPVAKGVSYKQIAERLVISHRTVQNHVQNTLTKLQLHNRVQLARYAIEHGLDDPPTPASSTRG
jgi:DNA-binding CsgD family transcriptional regulator